MAATGQISLAGVMGGRAGPLSANVLPRTLSWTACCVVLRSFVWLLEDF